MVIKTFQKYLGSIIRQGFESSNLFLVDSNYRKHAVNDIEKHEDHVSLSIGSTSRYDIKKIEKEMSLFSPSCKIHVTDQKTGDNYDLEGGWDVDDSENITMDINLDNGIQHHISCNAVNEYKDTDTSKYQEDYNPKDFSQKLSKFSSNLGIKAVYVALWLWKALVDATASVTAIITGALGYLVSATDIIPDILPIVGFVDDIGVLMAAYYSVIKLLNPKQISEISKKAKESLKKYFKDFDENDIKID